MEQFRSGPRVEDEDENPYFPSAMGPRIPNYYGDYVRQIFFVCGALMLVLTPFVGSSFPALLPFEIGGGLILVLLGALTSPTNHLSILADVIAAAAGALVYELLAISHYNAGNYIAFIEREAFAIALLIALYFGVKTLRNMESGRVGKRDNPIDFIAEPGDKRMLSRPGDGD